MRKPIAIAILMLSFPSSVLAQEKSRQLYFEGFGFFEVQGLKNTDVYSSVGLAGGGGGAILSSKGLGLGVDYAKGAPYEESRLSVNCYFGPPSTWKYKMEPFLTGGVTHFSVGNLGPPPVYGFNFGGGVNLWATRHAAMRLELRFTYGGQPLSIQYQSFGNYYTAPLVVPSLRIGMAFR